MLTVGDLSAVHYATAAHRLGRLRDGDADLWRAIAASLERDDWTGRELANCAWACARVIDPTDGNSPTDLLTDDSALTRAARRNGPPRGKGATRSFEIIMLEKRSV
jgi:hypothetical protein